MLITKELLKNLYQEYNKLYFNGVLGHCEFSFFPKKTTYLGWYNAKETKNGKPKDRIWIGVSMKWTEESLKIVLIHEMIHMYVCRIDGCKNDGILGHGKRFRKQAKHIKNNHGIDVLKLPKVEFIDKKNSPKLWERMILWLIDR